MFKHRQFIFSCAKLAFFQLNCLKFSSKSINFSRQLFQETKGDTVCKQSRQNCNQDMELWLNKHN